MTDGIIKGNGNSRYLKTVADALTLYPTYQDFMAAFIAGTLPVDLNGINAEGWRQIGTALNKGNLLTDETAEKLGLKLVWTPTTVSLSGIAEGETFPIMENGELVDFYVAKINYESGLNGAGRTLLARASLLKDTVAFNASGANTYASGTLDVFFNNTYKARLAPVIRSAIVPTKFYYTPGNGNKTVETLEREIFSLSVTEIGASNSATANIEGSELPIVSTLRIGEHWLRSPNISKTDQALFATGTSVVIASTSVSSQKSARPVFTLPSDFSYTYYTNQFGDIVDEIPVLESPTPAMAFEALYQRDFGTPVIEAVADGVTNVAFDLGELETGWYRVTQEGSTNSSKLIMVGTNNASYDKGSIMSLSPSNTAWQNKSGRLELYLRNDYLDFFLYGNGGRPYVTGISFDTGIHLFAYLQSGGSTPTLMQFSTAYFTAGTKITLSKLPPLKEV